MEKIPVKKKMKKLISQTQYLTQFLRPMTPGGRLAEHTVIFGSVPVLLYLD